MGPGLSNSADWYFVDLTDVTMADEYTNSRLTDDADRTIPGNMTVQLANISICD